MFGRKPKPNPKITVDGIDVSFDLRHSWWEFTFQGIDFISYELCLSLPNRKNLESIVIEINGLADEMRSRIATYFELAPEIDSSDGKLLHVDLASFAKNKTIHAAWSGEESWGDMGVDFTIKDRQIIDERWGD